MTEDVMKQASLAELRRMKDKGELRNIPQAPEGEDLGDEFWATAVLEEPRRIRSVHLKVDADVFDFFHQEANGKGHLTRMQNVLKAYVKARRKEPAA